MQNTEENIMKLNLPLITFLQVNPLPLHPQLRPLRRQQTTVITQVRQCQSLIIESLFQGCDVSSRVSGRSKRTNPIWICIWFGETKFAIFPQWYHIFVLDRTKRTNLIWFCIWFGEPKQLYWSQPWISEWAAKVDYCLTVAKMLPSFIYTRGVL